MDDEESAYTVASDSDTTGEEKPTNPFPEIAIGIDIGTSKCSMAIWNGTQVQLITNARNQTAMQSYVTFKDDVPATGVTNQPAHEQELLTGSAVFNVKRLIGRVDTDPIIHASKNLPFLVQTLDIGVRPFIAALVNNKVWRSTTPEEVLAIYLVELRALAETQLKRPIRTVVITVPVSFSRFQLTRIERVSAMAGLHVLRLIPEPTAIALLYAQHQQKNLNENTSSGNEKVAVIFNMGAGYCDVAVTITAGGISHIKALAGIPTGGEDIVLNLIRYISSHGGNGLLRVASLNAIHDLSFRTTTEINVDLGNGVKISKVISRDEFEEVNRDVFSKCEAVVKKCLYDAKLQVEDINDLIMVGGCSNIPMIRKIVMGICKKEELYTGIINPLEAAVIGAALEGAVASGISDPFGSLDLLTIQATPMSIGIRADGKKFIPIIRRNTTMPARREMVFTTVNDNQTEALIVVYEGDEELLDKNHLLGYFKVVGIPSAPKGVPEVEVCLDIDSSNVLRVFAGVMEIGTRQRAGAVMEVRMPNVDDGHGWCSQALNTSYGTCLDLITVQQKMVQP
ncbi:heat shock 70 kDa protein 8 [Impatiens glandulifera]|uniref:heat shock 70 kDa protein 8 n=1 Tax=Impatiens glandulifera TaxID=253017 RepID=UPI001FB15072|nr:heat shock 70 kDa protein 8 [Impatiens glandulifera]